MHRVAAGTGERSVAACGDGSYSKAYALAIKGGSLRRQPVKVNTACEDRFSYLSRWNQARDSQPPSTIQTYRIGLEQTTRSREEPRLCTPDTGAVGR